MSSHIPHPLPFGPPRFPSPSSLQPPASHPPPLALLPKCSASCLSLRCSSPPSTPPLPSLSLLHPQIPSSPSLMPRSLIVKPASFACLPPLPPPPSPTAPLPGLPYFLQTKLLAVALLPFVPPTRIKVKALTESTDIGALAQEIVDKCKLIHASKVTMIVASFLLLFQQLGPRWAPLAPLPPKHRMHPPPPLPSQRPRCSFPLAPPLSALLARRFLKGRASSARSLSCLFCRLGKWSRCWMT